MKPRLGKGILAAISFISDCHKIIAHFCHKITLTLSSLFFQIICLKKYHVKQIYFQEDEVISEDIVEADLA